MVKRNEKKAVVALSLALLLAFSLVASIIPGINSKAAGHQYDEVSLTFTAPTSGTVYNSNTDCRINSGVSVETTGVSHSVTVIGDKDYPMSGFSSYPTKLQDNTEYGAVIVVQCDQPSFFGNEVNINIQGATNVAKQIINEFTPGDPGTQEAAAIGIDVTKPALLIMATFEPTPSTDPVDPVDPVTPVNPDTPVTPANTDANTVPTSNQATPSADTTSNTTKATAPKTEDALPIVLIISIIGAGALTSVITIVSRKRQ